MIFRKGVEQLEIKKKKLNRFLKTLEEEGQKIKLNITENLMKRIQNVKMLMDTSYSSLSKYDMEELRAYQVFIYLKVY